MSSVRPQDLLVYVGGEVLERYGVFRRRISPSEDAPLDVTATAGQTAIDRDGSTVTYDADQARVEWIDRDGDGERETAMLKVDANDFTRIDFPWRVQPLTLFGDYQIVTVANGRLAAISGDTVDNRVSVEISGSTIEVIFEVGGTTLTAATASIAGITAGDRLRWMAKVDPVNGTARAWAQVEDGAIDAGTEQSGSLTYAGTELFDDQILGIGCSFDGSEDIDALVRSLKVAKGVNWMFSQMEAAGR